MSNDGFDDYQYYDAFDTELMSRMTPDDLEEYTKILEEYEALGDLEEPDMTTEEYIQKLTTLGYLERANANSRAHGRMLDKYMLPGD